MGSMCIANVIKAISDYKSLVHFNIIALGSGNPDILMSRLKLTRKQYYSRMSEVTKAGIIRRKNGNYFLTSFGKIVYAAQLMIGKAVESYWKLKALDSFKLSSSGRPVQLLSLSIHPSFLFSKTILLSVGLSISSNNFLSMDIPWFTTIRSRDTIYLLTAKWIYAKLLKLL
jgi:hypothetical protein